MKEEGRKGMMEGGGEGMEKGVEKICRKRAEKV